MFISISCEMHVQQIQCWSGLVFSPLSTPHRFLSFTHTDRHNPDSQSLYLSPCCLKPLGRSKCVNVFDAALHSLRLLCWLVLTWKSFHWNELNAGVHLRQEWILGGNIVDDCVSVLKYIIFLFCVALCFFFSNSTWSHLCSLPLNASEAFPPSFTYQKVLV